MAQVKEKYLIMSNAEDLGEGFRLFDRLTDTGALLEGPDAHWGEMVRQGGTIIQTDWPHFMSTYRESEFGQAVIEIDVKTYLRYEERLGVKLSLLAFVESV